MAMFNFLSITRIFIGISGCFSVLFGAWLAHAAHVLPVDIQQRLETAHLYQIIHTLALLAILIWYQHNPTKLVKTIAIGFTVGIILFSGGLYMKTISSFIPWGKFAPLGGVTLALSWLALIFVGNKKL